MPGVFNLSVDEAVKEAEACAALGLGGFLLFGLPAEKDEQATGTYAADGIVQQGLRALKSDRSARLVGPDRRRLPLRVHLARPLRDRARATAIQPIMKSKMTRHSRSSPNRRLPRPGRRGHRRPQRHDGRPCRGHPRVARCLFAPEHAHPQLRVQVRLRLLRPLPRGRRLRPQFGDRRSYQMDGANLREAMREIDQDISEGADMILMKPALPYLDVIRAARERYDVPLGAYQVSGEYSMLHAPSPAAGSTRARHAGIAALHPPRRRRLCCAASRRTIKSLA